MTNDKNKDNASTLYHGNHSISDGDGDGDVAAVLGDVNSNSRIVVGRTRVRSSKTGGYYRGTVAYVGTVASAPWVDRHTVYAGIVWDDPDRGKHDGSVVCRTTNQLVRHGFCARHATAASFVKLQRLLLVENESGTLGTSCTGQALTVELLRQKYVDLDDAECVAPNNLLPHMAQTASGRNNKAIELLGELKIRKRQQLSDLTSISLRLAGISSIVAPSSSSSCWQQLQHVQEIDLAGNLLWEWEQVWNLLGERGCLPNLRKLSVASNRLGDWHYDTNQQQVYPKVRHLNVNETNIQKVSTILALGRAFPSLEELVLANNATNQAKFYLVAESSTRDENSSGVSSPLCIRTNVDVVDDDDDDLLPSQLATAFDNLKFLDCSNCTGLFSNPVQAWSQLPNLQSLSLDDNPDISSFSKPTTASSSDSVGVPTMAFYPSLRHLQLAGTNIAHWKDVLAAWQPLTSLRLRSCPLVAHVSRTQLLAHLPRLQQLNASVVAVSERREAARWCLWRRMQHLNDNNDDVNEDYYFPESILNHWKTEFPELADAAAAAASRHRQSPTSTTNLVDLSSTHNTELAVINVTIRSVAADSCTMEPLLRRLPTQLTVAKVKALCARQFGLDRDWQTLHCRKSPDDGFPECLDCNDQTLAYYGVPDGAELLMDELNVVEQQRTAVAEAQQQLERVQEQERELYAFRERQKRANMQ